MTREAARVLFSAIVHDGIDPSRLSQKAKEEIRAAIDVILREVEKKEAI